jgi:DNA recombination protein RmuC
MNSDLSLLLSFVAGLALGGIVVFLLLRARSREAAAERDGLVDAFKALSADALERNNQRFLELAKLSLERQQAQALGELEKRQQAIGELVAPMKESLSKFEQQIANVEKSRIDAYATLTQQVRALAESQGQLKSETANLVKALRAPHTRGRWGEIQLKRVVEMAGMLDHCDFFEQESTDRKSTRLNPSHNPASRMPSSA